MEFGSVSYGGCLAFIFEFAILGLHTVEKCRTTMSFVDTDETLLIWYICYFTPYKCGSHASTHQLSGLPNNHVSMHAWSSNVRLAPIIFSCKTLTLGSPIFKSNPSWPHSQSIENPCTSRYTNLTCNNRIVTQDGKPTSTKKVQGQPYAARYYSLNLWSVK